MDANEYRFVNPTLAYWQAGLEPLDEETDEPTNNGATSESATKETTGPIVVPMLVDDNLPHSTSATEAENVDTSSNVFLSTPVTLEFYICHHCGVKKYNSLMALKYHIAWCGGHSTSATEAQNVDTSRDVSLATPETPETPKTYTCHVCGVKKCTTPMALNYHIAWCRGPPPPPPLPELFTCPNCSTIYTLKGNLARHLRICKVLFPYRKTRSNFEKRRARAFRKRIESEGETLFAEQERLFEESRRRVASTSPAHTSPVVTTSPFPEMHSRPTSTSSLPSFPTSGAFDYRVPL